MKTRRIVIGAAVVIIGLPVVLVLIARSVDLRSGYRTNGTIVFSGQKREYLLYVPRSYDRGKPTPLVISMHGGALLLAAQMGHTWPGGTPLPEWIVGPTSRTIDASSLMWAFFREHRLREAQTATPHK